MEGFSSASSCFPFVTNKRNSCERTSATGLLSQRSFEAENGKGDARGTGQDKPVNNNGTL